MIRVDPARIGVPLVLQQKAADERQKASAFYLARQGKAAFDFRLYRERDVKDALMLLFSGKCAYCESPFAAMHPVDVEHWRPKGDVEEDDGTRRGAGYYWLAAEWTNLLPSCIDCNRRREHLVLPTGEKRVTGKGNFFPLRPGSPRAARDGEEGAEQPLLLHPYFDEPESALEVVLEEEAGRGVLLPHAAAHPDARPKAEASIRVYALNRTELVQARQAMLYQMEQHMYVVRQLLRVLKEKLSPTVRGLVLDLMEHEMKFLHEFALPDRPYSLCALQALKTFKEELARGSNTP